MKTSTAVLFALLLSAGLAVPAAHAITEVTVMNDQAKMLVVPGKAGTVVVGNPNIADVTVQGSQVFIHGRNFGTTNVLVYDRDGNELATLEVNVMMGGSQNVAVFRRAERYSYVCAPLCETVHQIGDQFDWYKNMTDENKQKGALATGSEKASDSD